MAKKLFTAAGTFVAPAGVTRVNVYSIRRPGKHYGNAFVKFDIDVEGELWATGNGANGGLGDGTVASKSSPVKVSGNLRFQQMASGGSSDTNHVIGIARNGQAWAWGTNSSGVLGTGNNTSAFSSPQTVTGGLKFKKIVMGTESHTLGLQANGTLYAWGNNATGELGQSNQTLRSSPVAVVGGLTWLEIGADYQSSAGISSAFEVYCWGRNTEGQLGQGNNGAGTDKSSPVKVTGLTGLSFVKVVPAGLTWLALTTTGRVWGWGSNSIGELGDGTAGFGNDKFTPVSCVQGSLVFTELYSAQDPSTGGAGIIAKASNGNYYGWGSNASGQLGSNNVTPKSSPVQVLTGHDFLWLNPNGQGFSGIKKDGSIWAWGFNTQGQLGDGTIVPKSTPVQLLSHPLYKSNPELSQQAIDVTPGTSYAIVIADNEAQFGSFPVGPFGDAIVVEW